MRSILVLSLFIAPAFAKDLQMYWIDVEGGAATLIVSPSGQSLLIDTGWEVDGRDAKRIVAAARDAGVTKIDHLIISHYHADHVGGLAALSKLIPILNFYGRGDQVEDVNKPWYNSFVGAAQGKRTIVKPGGKIPIAGLDALVVASDSKMLTKPVKGGGPNALCANAAEQTPAGIENQYMVGVRVAYGKLVFSRCSILIGKKKGSWCAPSICWGRSRSIKPAATVSSMDRARPPCWVRSVRKWW